MNARSNLISNFTPCGNGTDGLPSLLLNQIVEVVIKFIYVHLYRLREELGKQIDEQKLKKLKDKNDRAAADINEDMWFKHFETIQQQPGGSSR